MVFILSDSYFLLVCLYFYYFYLSTNIFCAIVTQNNLFFVVCSWWGDNLVLCFSIRRYLHSIRRYLHSTYYNTKQIYFFMCPVGLESNLGSICHFLSGILCYLGAFCHLMSYMTLAKIEGITTCTQQSAWTFEETRALVF